MPSTTSLAVRLIAYTAVLYVSFAHNIFWVPSGVYVSRDGFRTGYVGYDSDLVMNRIGMARDGVDTVHPLYWWDYHHHRGGYIYLSQCGPQGMVLGEIYRLVGGDVEEFAGYAACGSALLTALVLSSFFTSIAVRIGSTTANVAVLLTSFTPVMLPFATSLYWALFLLLAPFVATWLLEPVCKNSLTRYAGLCATIAGLVCLKCLCGYEYISTVILSPVAAIVYHRAANGERWRRCVLPAAAIMAAGVVGFAAAIGLHVLQLQHITGGNALDVIRERAAGNTVGTSFDPAVASSCMAPEFRWLPPDARVRVRCVLNYLYLPAVATPTTWGPLRGFVPLGLVLLAAAVMGGLAWRKRSVNPAAAALLPASAVALLGAVAWHGVALTHTCIHMHLNQICYAVPWLLLAYTLLGWGVQRAAERLPFLRFAPGIAAIGVFAGNLIADRAAYSDHDADARVEAVLQGNADLDPPLQHHLGPVTVMNESPRQLGTEAWYHCRLRPEFNGTGTPTRVHTGWAIAGRARDARPTITLVVVAGGKVLPVPVHYSRIELTERKTRGDMTSNFFVTAVPEDAIPAGEKLRLFAVTADRVTELSVPEVTR
jgi:hypothetical protein